MFPRKPHATKQWRFRENNVAAVPPLAATTTPTAEQAKKSRIRRTLEEMKKREEALNAKNKLISFVTQKLLHSIGPSYRQTVEACVESFFEVKRNFTSEDVNGLERVIRESIKTAAKPRSASRSRLTTAHPRGHAKTLVPVLGGGVPPAAATDAVRAPDTANDTSRGASKTRSLARQPVSMKNFREGLDEQMDFARTVKERARHDWLVEVRGGRWMLWR